MGDTDGQTQHSDLISFTLLFKERRIKGFATEVSRDWIEPTVSSVFVYYKCVSTELICGRMLHCRLQILPSEPIEVFCGFSLFLRTKVGKISPPSSFICSTEVVFPSKSTLCNVYSVNCIVKYSEKVNMKI